MIQVWCYDKNGVFTESVLVEKLGESMTTISPNGLGLYCKVFDGENWVEGWTEEKIQAWKDNQTAQELPLADKIQDLEEENKRLKEQVKTITQQATFIEDCLLEVAQIIYV